MSTARLFHYFIISVVRDVPEQLCKPTELPSLHMNYTDRLPASFIMQPMIPDLKRQYVVDATVVVPTMVHLPFLDMSLHPMRLEGKRHLSRSHERWKDFHSLNLISHEEIFRFKRHENGTKDGGGRENGR